METTHHLNQNYKLILKIGIITYHGSHNYGAQLQAKALQETLLGKGHQVQFLNYRSEGLLASNQKIPKLNSLKNALRYFCLLPFVGKLKKRYQLFEKFTNEQLTKTEVFHDLDQLGERFSDLSLDLLVVGSDQVWGMDQGGNPFFFVRFLKNRSIPVIAYAPSFGSASIPSEMEKRFSEWAQVFDHLSVREKSGKVLAERLLKKPVKLVLDPVFMIDPSYWKEYASKRPVKENYLVCYSLETSARFSKVVATLSKRLNLPVVILGKPDRFMLQCRSIVAIDSGPREFLEWIQSASLVVTNSFHSTCFSRLFEVPFVSVTHSKRNARIEDVLEVLGESWRMIESAQDLEEDPNTYLRKPTPLARETQPEFFDLKEGSIKYLDAALTKVER